MNRYIRKDRDHDPQKRQQLAEAIRAKDLKKLHELLDGEGNYVGAYEFNLACAYLTEALEPMTNYMLEHFYGYKKPPRHDH